MTDRDKILRAITLNQPALKALPPDYVAPNEEIDLVAKFTNILTAIGGQVIHADNNEVITNYLNDNTTAGQRIINNLIPKPNEPDVLPHTFKDVEVAVIKAHFGVAENGAVWITESLLNQRVLPFITQQLVVVLSKQNIVANMHEAYARIGITPYGFGTFIAGPSKTADIEQSLVLGAHGSRTMTVFLTD